MGINLTKGQTIDLNKTAGSALSAIAAAAGWDPVKKKSFFGLGGGGSIDLDASCAVFSGKNLIDTVWFRKKVSDDRAIVHSGDNLTGDGDGDDETINIDLSRISSSATAIVFTINSFQGQTFNEVANAYTRIIDLKTNAELCRFSLSDAGPHTGMIVGVLKKTAEGWTFTAIGERTNGRTIEQMSSQMVPYLR